MLIVATMVARLVFAASFGLGVDESYMVAAGRRLQLSYYDHPPTSWWLAWGAAHLFGSESALVVRFPFILLFGLSTLLMYRCAKTMFGPDAAVWAAISLNLAPVFGIATGTWVLPDGPLIAALLGALACLLEALPSKGRVAWLWWLAAGACLGLALASKYTAVLTLLGAGLYLLTEPTLGRRWLWRPHPYAALLVGLAVFSPALVWNSEHQWISFLFQAGRGAGKLRLLGPVRTLAGEALFLVPWIWAALLACAAGAGRLGPSNPGKWLLLCLAGPPVFVFLALSLWAHVLAHWSAPGYLMLFPLLGDFLARRWAVTRWLRRAVALTAGLVVLLPVIAVSEVETRWIPASAFPKNAELSLATVDWKQIATEVSSQRRFDPPGVVVATTRWFDAGKLDYALGGSRPVICISGDRREYGLIAPLSRFYGKDVVIVAPNEAVEEVRRQFGPLFESISMIPGGRVDAGRGSVAEEPLFLGRRLHPTAVKSVSHALASAAS